jgi:hypothetical protein
VFGAEVFMMSTSTWAVDCSIESAIAAWRFVDGCGWSVCGMCGLGGCLSGGCDLLCGCLG